MSIRRITMAAAAAILFAGCGDGGTGLDAVDLQGTWTATVYEFTDNANASNVVDIIARDGATFTLTVDASGTASTLLDDGVGGSSSDSGTLDGTGTSLTLGGVVFAAVRNGNVLTLTNADQDSTSGVGLRFRRPCGS